MKYRKYKFEGRIRCGEVEDNEREGLKKGADGLYQFGRRGNKPVITRGVNLRGGDGAGHLSAKSGSLLPDGGLVCWGGARESN